MKTEESKKFIRWCIFGAIGGIFMAPVDRCYIFALQALHRDKKRPSETIPRGVWSE